MNKVSFSISIAQPRQFKLEDLCGRNLQSYQTAFIGQCGYGPKNTLYLVTYHGIIVADDPSKAWSDGDCTVLVDRFVDVEIMPC